VSDLKVAVVVDSSKLWQLANFYCKITLRKPTLSPLEIVCSEAFKRGWKLITTEVNLRRAVEDFRKTLSNIEDEKREILIKIVEQRIKLLIDVINERDIPYTANLTDAIAILEDYEEEPEDSHALALAISLKQSGYSSVIIWTGDNDFFKKEKEISSLGIELRNKLI
jgi:hypothetical protein